jgi:RNA polymerase sigma-70 factor, ECF subfamily
VEPEDQQQQQGKSDVTILLKQWKSGDASALEQVTPLVYEELRRLAASYLRREREGHTLQPTALLNEAYMRLVAVEQDFSSRAHFFGVAAHLMRLILVDHARSKRRQKRGGGEAAVPLEESMAVAQSRPETLLALDEGLRQLAAFDERKAKVIEMRFFGGMNLEETAEALDISQATVGREQRMAEAWLNRYLSGKSGSLRRPANAPPE